MVGQLQPVQPPAGPYLPRQKVRAVWMRAGTSKGLFLHRHDLPESQSEWAPIILSIMGSRLGDPRQLDGLGGATSTTTKVVLVEKSTRPGIDVEYTFVQVSITEAKVDVSGNCGNMASGVGPFALDEGMVRPGPGESEIDVRIFNTNTNRVLVETVAVAQDGTFEENGDYRIAGVKGTGSRIKVSFLSPAGSMTGKLFPTGKRTEIISVYPPTAKLWDRLMVRATLIDCANPFVLVENNSLPSWYYEKGPGDDQSLELIEQIRREASVRFGLTSSMEKAASIRGTPKIAVVSALTPEMAGENTGEEAVLHVTAYSMGKVHPSLQLTGAVCIGMSLSVPGTVSSDPLLSTSKPVRSPGDMGGCIGYQGVTSYSTQSDRQKRWKIRHGSGEIEAEVTLSDLPEEEGEAVESIAVFRTARRLFEGSALFH